MRKLVVLTLMIFTLALTGCGKSDTPKDDANASGEYGFDSSEKSGSEFQTSESLNDSTQSASTTKNGDHLELYAVDNTVLKLYYNYKAEIQYEGEGGIEEQGTYMINDNEVTIKFPTGEHKYIYKVEETDGAKSLYSTDYDGIAFTERYSPNFIPKKSTEIEKSGSETLADAITEMENNASKNDKTDDSETSVENEADEKEFITEEDLIKDGNVTIVDETEKEEEVKETEDGKLILRDELYLPDDVDLEVNPFEEYPYMQLETNEELIQQYNKFIEELNKNADKTDDGIHTGKPEVTLTYEEYIKYFCKIEKPKDHEKRLEEWYKKIEEEAKKQQEAQEK